MPWKAGCFLLGCWWLQRSAGLPSWAVVAAVGGVALAFALAARGRGWPLSALAWLLAGWTLAAGQALLDRPPALPWAVERADWQADWVVERLPVRRHGITRLVVRIERLERQGERVAGDWRVRLSWRDAPELHVGQRWRTPVRLKPAHSYRNAGSWDYAGWLYRQGIRYRGYVNRGDRHLLGETACCLLERLRERWRETLRARVDAGPGRALLLALVLGDRSEVDPAMRQALQRTGTSHLLAISGLHIGLIAALTGGLAGWVWRRTPGCRRVPARLIAVAVGLGFAALYALASGFGLPARRALAMLAILAWLLWQRRDGRTADAFSLALILVLAAEPTAVLEAGFWLSFVAVAAILTVLPHLRERPVWQQALGVQLAVSLALYPVLLAFDMPSSLLSVPVNLVLVPLFGLVLMPALLLVLLLSAWSDWPLELADTLLDGLWRLLHRLGDGAPMLPGPPVTEVGVALLVLAVVLLLIAPGWRLRLPGAVLLLAVHLPRVPALATGEFTVDVLDVGQGLSLVVRTARHRLVYDAGPAYGSGFNLAEVVVLPWLRHHGIGSVDRLVLSHGDRDHAGGAEALVRQVRIGEVLSGEPQRLPVAGRRCHAGEHWRWDGVEFRFVQPDWAARRRGNNASCVLAVMGPGGRALFMGDAETSVERALLPWLREHAPFDLVVAGHHGSTTSSSAAFVAAVDARHLVYTVGYRNRYGFPRPEVDARWRQAGATRWRTDGCGSLRFRFLESGLAVQDRAGAQPRYWRLRDVPCR